MVLAVVALMAIAAPRAHGLGIECAVNAAAAGSALAELGARFDPYTQTLRVRLFSERARRVALLLFASARGNAVAEILLSEPDAEGVRSADIAAAALRGWGLLGHGARYLDRAIYYGFRLWGPNWEYEPEWRPGSGVGHTTDVDGAGNRFNPNKLVVDPLARELSHNPAYHFGRRHLGPYASGANRLVDTAPFAPRGVIFPELPPSNVPRAQGAFRDDIVYELNVRGFTRNDPEVPREERGTFLGLARKIPYLVDLGVTAVELQPVHEFQNAVNRATDTSENNYWGYMSLSYIAPTRRYATRANRQVPGGTTAEFREMCTAFHRAGLKVGLDVVFNHTGEGGVSENDPFTALLLSLRGLDSASYYQLAADPRFYMNNSGCGSNLNCRHRVVAELILASLRYYRDLGVDFFRFDLASVLGNAAGHGEPFRFDAADPEGVLQRILFEFARAADGGPGTDLIVEPWGVGSGTYQVGNFLPNAARGVAFTEWNPHFRDGVRRALNRFGLEHPTPGELANRIAGSDGIFRRTGRRPWHSLNYVVSHDGFTLFDLVSYNGPNNSQPAPYGPSDGGEPNNISWDQSVPGDTPELRATRQRQAARNGFLLPMVSFGVPMFTAGDEFLRSQNGNNNMWNVDSRGSWVDWRDRARNAAFFAFARGAVRFRRAHAAFRPADWATGALRPSGLPDLAWYLPDGTRAEDTPHMEDPRQAFLAWRLDAGEERTRSIFVAYNWHAEGVPLTIPAPAEGKRWYWVADTDARFEETGNVAAPGQEVPLDQHITREDGAYELAGRSMLVLVER